MKRQHGISAFILCIILFLQLPLAYAYGESSPEDTREILQKSLSIVEIDHEIERITERQKQLGQQQRHYPSSFRNRKNRYIFSKIGPEL